MLFDDFIYFRQRDYVQPARLGVMYPFSINPDQSLIFPWITYSPVERCYKFFPYAALFELRYLIVQKFPPGAHFLQLLFRYLHHFILQKSLLLKMNLIWFSLCRLRRQRVYQEIVHISPEKKISAIFLLGQAGGDFRWENHLQVGDNLLAGTSDTSAHYAVIVQNMLCWQGVHTKTVYIDSSPKSAQNALHGRKIGLRHLKSFIIILGQLDAKLL